MRIVQHPGFDAQVSSAVLEFERIDPRLALRFADAVEEMLDVLSRMPTIGEQLSVVHPELTGLRGYRIRRFKKYLICYRLHEEEVRLVALVHSARDLVRLFSTEAE